MVGNRGIYNDGWIANTTPFAPPWDLATRSCPDVVNGYKWELYNIAEDFTQNNDLAAKNPAKLKEMQDLFERRQRSTTCCRSTNRVRSAADAAAKRSRREDLVHLHRRELRHSDRQCADILDKDFTISADITVPRRRRRRNDRDVRRPLRRLRHVLAEGQAGVRLQPARPGAVPLGRRRRRRATDLRESLAPGKHTLVFDFKYDGPGPGKGGTGVFKVDGKEMATQKLEHTIPLLMTIDETFDVGVDTRTPVDESYEMPFRFNGTIDKLTYKLGPSQLAAADQASPGSGRASAGLTSRYAAGSTTAPMVVAAP